MNRTVNEKSAQRLIRKHEVLQKKLSDVIKKNERLKQKIADRKEEIPLSVSDASKRTEDLIRKTDGENRDIILLNRALREDRAALQYENRILRREVFRIKHPVLWRLAWPLRIVKTVVWKGVGLFRLAFVLLKHINPSNIKKVCRSLKTIGLRRTLFSVTHRRNVQGAYRIGGFNDPTSKELEKQRHTVFLYAPKISVLVPMYNTPLAFFEELVRYMIAQTYPNWELCLEDGSPQKNAQIEEICKKDSRILYRYTGNNLGIAGNTNEALKRATGDYIGLLDHDDLLTANCLFEVVKAINDDPDVEFLYTDEDKITTTDKACFEPYFKPDFAIDKLRTVNYICHFSVFRRDVMEKLGGERSEYDGAQDYDLILRMAEIAKNIKHIPKILYHWRVHERSTAAVGEVKPYAFEAGIKVLEDHLKRVGLEGTVSHGATLGTYRIEYKGKKQPSDTEL